MRSLILKGGAQPARKEKQLMSPCGGDFCYSAHDDFTPCQAAIFSLPLRRSRDGG
jgi:hypothetical protein